MCDQNCPNSTHIKNCSKCCTIWTIELVVIRSLHLCALCWHAIILKVCCCSSGLTITHKLFQMACHHLSVLFWVKKNKTSWAHNLPLCPWHSTSIFYCGSMCEWRVFSGSSLRPVMYEKCLKEWTVHCSLCKVRVESVYLCILLPS